MGEMYTVSATPAQKSRVDERPNTRSESLFSLRIHTLGGSNCGRHQLENSSREVRMLRSVMQRQLSRQ